MRVEMVCFRPAYSSEISKVTQRYTFCSPNYNWTSQNSIRQTHILSMKLIHHEVFELSCLQSKCHTHRHIHNIINITYIPSTSGKGTNESKIFSHLKWLNYKHTSQYAVVSVAYKPSAPLFMQSHRIYDTLTVSQFWTFQLWNESTIFFCSFFVFSFIS